MRIGDIIKQYREEHGQTQRSMAKLLDCSYAYVGMLEKGINPKTNKEVQPSIEIFKRLAALMGIDLDTLIQAVDGNQPIKIPADPARTIGQPVAMIPVYGRIVAGEPREAVEEILGYTAILDKNAHTEDLFGLKVFGESMQPTFLDGDTVIIHKQPTVDSGQVAVVLIENEEATVKRVFISPDGITISADNPAVFRQRFYTNEEIETLPVRILGRVVSFSREI